MTTGLTPATIAASVADEAAPPAGAGLAAHPERDGKAGAGSVIVGVNHLGIVVRDIDAALPFYVDTLGMTVSHQEELPAVGVRLVYLETGSGTVQLLQPIGPGPAWEQLELHGEGPDHICYTVDDIPSTLASLAPDAEVPIFTAGRGRRACFLPGRHHGLRIELVEQPAGT